MFRLLGRKDHQNQNQNGEERPIKVRITINIDCPQDCPTQDCPLGPMGVILRWVIISLQVISIARLNYHIFSQFM